MISFGDLPKKMVPPNHPFVHRVFHCKPSILGGKTTPIFGSTPIWGYTKKNTQAIGPDVFTLQAPHLDIFCAKVVGKKIVDSNPVGGFFLQQKIIRNQLLHCCFLTAIIVATVHWKSPKQTGPVESYSMLYIPRTLWWPLFWLEKAFFWGVDLQK